MSNRTTERLLPGEGEELVRRALEDGVIARERDRDRHEGWTIADIAHDLGISDERARKMVRQGGGVNLRAGQVLSLRPRIRAAVRAAMEGAAPDRRRTAESHVRNLGALVGDINRILDRAVADGEIDDDESAELRAAMRALSSAAATGAEDLGRGR